MDDDREDDDSTESMEHAVRALSRDEIMREMSQKNSRSPTQYTNVNGLD